MSFRDHTEIVFAAGELLSAAMLEESYRYPREFLRLYHAASPDGIIRGLDFVSREDGVYLTVGIVKLRGIYYTMPQDVSMGAWISQQKEPLLEGVEYFFCISQEDVMTSENATHGIAARSRITLKALRNRPEGSLLLGKYKHRADRPLQLPTLQVNDADPFAAFTQASYVQLMESEYAHPRGETTYHPLLFRAMQSYLEQKKMLSPYDFSLLTELQNNGIVALRTLRAYVAANREESLALSLQLTREKLFREVTACLAKPYYPAVRYEAPATEEQEVRRAIRRNKLID